MKLNDTTKFIRNGINCCHYCGSDSRLIEFSTLGTDVLVYECEECNDMRMTCEECEEEDICKVWRWEPVNLCDSCYETREREEDEEEE